MRVLCVAEKPSIAKSISQVLSHGALTNRPGSDKFCRNYDFTYRLPRHALQAGAGRRSPEMVAVEMTFTSVRGHMTEVDFPDEFRWGRCDIATLFTAPTVTSIAKDAERVARNLAAEARRADVLMIWTDCDREGEHIGLEIVQHCQRAQARLVVKRARFSALIASQLHNACMAPGELDYNAAYAVEARQQIDLRTGAAFTRLQTGTLKATLPDLDGLVISYGPCQFPALGFVVDHYRRVQAFVPEPFWFLDLRHHACSDAGATTPVEFLWDRKHLFDEAIVRALHTVCTDAGDAVVVQTTRRPTRKRKPTPLTTVELQKSASRLFGLAPKRILDVAEALYQRGLLSYPRTETDQYDKKFDFAALLEKQRGDASWGAHVQQLVASVNGQAEGSDALQYERPRDGTKNDKAHPPIHPTAHANGLAGDEKKVYDYVARRFLASCATDALGEETNVALRLGGEGFHASGLVVRARNYLRIFTYDTWKDKEMPVYTQGQRLRAACDMKPGSTTRPSLLTEADLVGIMDKNGIGTDATIADHIRKIIDRQYVMVQKQGKTNYLVPSTLGMGLVEGYSSVPESKSLCLPQLRRETEEKLGLVASAAHTKDAIVSESMVEYARVFAAVRANFLEITRSVQKYLRGELGEEGDGGDGGGGGAREEWPPASRRTTSSRAAASASSPEATMCTCDLIAKRVVTANGPNQGRAFWTCSKESARARCKFFAWADEAADPPPPLPAPRKRAAARGRTRPGASGRRAAVRGGRAEKSAQSCFQCGGEGHWANACANCEKRDEGTTTPWCQVSRAECLWGLRTSCAESVRMSLDTVDRVPEAMTDFELGAEYAIPTHMDDLGALYASHGLAPNGGGQAREDSSGAAHALSWTGGVDLAPPAAQMPLHSDVYGHEHYGADHTALQQYDPMLGEPDAAHASGGMRPQPCIGDALLPAAAPQNAPSSFVLGAAQHRPAEERQRGDTPHQAMDAVQDETLLEGIGNYSSFGQGPYASIDTSTTPASVFSAISSASTTDFLSPLTSPALHPQTGRTARSIYGMGAAEVHELLTTMPTSSHANARVGAQGSGAFSLPGGGFAADLDSAQPRAEKSAKPGVSPGMQDRAAHSRRGRSATAETKAVKVRPSPLMKPSQSPSVGASAGSGAWAARRRDAPAHVWPAPHASPSLGALESLSGTMHDASALAMPSPALSPVAALPDARSAAPHPRALGKGAHSHARSPNQAGSGDVSPAGHTPHAHSSMAPLTWYSASGSHSPVPGGVASARHDAAQAQKPVTPGAIMGIAQPGALPMSSATRSDTPTQRPRAGTGAHGPTVEARQGSAGVSESYHAATTSPPMGPHAYASPGIALGSGSAAGVALPDSGMPVSAPAGPYEQAAGQPMSAPLMGAPLYYPGTTQHKTILPSGLSSAERNAWMSTRRVGSGGFDQRRTSHKAAEQKRRDSLKHCFDDLRGLLPAIALDENLPYGSALGPDGTREDQLADGFDPDAPPNSEADAVAALCAASPEHAKEANKAVAKVLLLRHSNEYLVRLKRRIARRDAAVQALGDEVMRLRALLGEQSAGDGPGARPTDTAGDDGTVRLDAQGTGDARGHDASSRTPLRRDAADAPSPSPLVPAVATGLDSLTIASERRSDEP
ncbi:DNA topoisomerase [Malassezia sp. CBS 17886]|nr:DNA topoisomerase [Malassezia sp. CBS 17886]